MGFWGFGQAPETSSARKQQQARQLRGEGTDERTAINQSINHNGDELSLSTQTTRADEGAQTSHFAKTFIAHTNSMHTYNMHVHIMYTCILTLVVKMY